jgi:hypothetical protein
MSEQLEVCLKRERNGREQLEWCVQRHLITPQQAMAGNAFAHDAEQAHVSHLRHADMRRVPSAKTVQGFTMTAGDAARRYRKACELLGPLREIVELVCVSGKSAKAWTDKHKYDHKAAVPMLKEGLIVLVGFYQLTDAT